MYKALLDKIFKAYPMYHKIGSAAYKEGLENIEALMDILDHPERKFRRIKKSIDKNKKEWYNIDEKERAYR